MAAYELAAAAGEEIMSFSATVVALGAQDKLTRQYRHQLDPAEYAEYRADAITEVCKAFELS